MLTADCARSIGLIEERFFLVHEEADLCLRASQAGFKLAVVGEVLVWHKGSSSLHTPAMGCNATSNVRNLAFLLRRHAAGCQVGVAASARGWSIWNCYYV